MVEKNIFELSFDILSLSTLQVIALYAVFADLFSCFNGFNFIGLWTPENYVYDLYTMTDEMDINTDDTLASYPL